MDQWKVACGKKIINALKSLDLFFSCRTLKCWFILLTVFFLTKQWTQICSNGQHYSFNFYLFKHMVGYLKIILFWVVIKPFAKMLMIFLLILLQSRILWPIRQHWRSWPWPLRSWRWDVHGPKEFPSPTRRNISTTTTWFSTVSFLLIIFYLKR